MVDFEELKDELDSEWNTAVISKPSFYELQKRQSLIYPNSLFIDCLPSELNPIGTSGAADIVETSFSIKIVSKTRSDLEKFFQEVKRIINSKTISGGHWRIRSTGNPYINYKRHYQDLMGSELIFTNINSWS